MALWLYGPMALWPYNSITLQIFIDRMGNERIIGLCAPSYSPTEGLQPHEPSADFARFIGLPTIHLPCESNHIYCDLMNEQLAPEEESRRGVAVRDGYYCIPSYGIEYKGEWQEGVPHGEGEVLFMKGGAFKGWLTQGVANGSDSLMISRNGSYYRGGVVDNLRKGKGKYVHDGYSYNGDWNNNVPEGQGEQVFANGDSYRGRFFGGVKQDTEGRYEWSNDKLYKTYTGDFINNSIDGEGRLLFVNGEVRRDFFSFSKLQAEMPLNSSKIHAIQQRRIEKSILEAYQDSVTHGEALSKMRISLPDYTCQQTDSPRLESKDAILLSICGKNYRVEPKQLSVFASMTN